jgi:WD40 repeat protein
MATSSRSSSALHHIDCSDQPLDLSFHPTRNHIVAAALVDGTVEVHDFDEKVITANAGDQDQHKQGTLLQRNNNDDDDDDEQDTIVSSTAVHTQILPSKRTEDGTKKASCRAVHFSLDGQTLYTGGSAGDLVGLDAARLITFSAENKKKNSSMQWRVPLAAVGKTGIQVVHEFKQPTPEGETSSNTPLQPHLLVTGDEGGGVRIWDTRLVSKTYNNSGNINSSSSTANATKKPTGCVQSWKVHDDYVSGLENSADGNTLLSSSADCTMAVFDLRMASSQQHNKDAAVRQSDDLEDELLSIQIMKHGRKVVCGTGQGVLSLFSWGTWGDVSDRFPGHPASIDALLKVDEDTLLTGSSDGMIRVVQIQPDKLIGVLNGGDDHDGGFPIEKLAFNANRDFVGSVTHDNFIRIWDARILKEGDDDDDDEEKEVGDFRVLDATAMAVETSSAARPRNSNNNNNDNSDDEWDDMDEDDEEMQDNNDDDDVGNDNDSDDSDSDDSDNDRRPKRGGKNENRQKRFQSDNDKFFQDL